MFLDKVYNVNELGTMSEGVVVIPDGEYHAVIDSVDGKPTKDGQGEYAELTVRITQGNHVGTVLVDRLNLINNNEQAVRIAFQVLADICRALGMQQTPQDLSTLAGKPLVIKTKVKKGKDWNDPQTGQIVQGTDRTEIAKYKPSNGAPLQQAAQQEQPLQENPVEQKANTVPSKNPFIKQAS